MKHTAILAGLFAALTLPGIALADNNVRQVHDYIKQKYPEKDVGGRVIIPDAKAFVAYLSEKFGKPVMVGSGKDKTDYGWLLKVRNDSYNNCVEITLNPKKQAVTYPLDIGIGKCDSSRLQRLGYKVTAEIDNLNK